LGVHGIAYLSNRGLVMAVPAQPAWGWIALAALVGAAAATLVVRHAGKLRRGASRRFPFVSLTLGLLAAPPMLVWLLAGTPTQMDVPVLQGFNFRGGLTVSPEFITLFLGLSLYIAAFMGEIVRSGIQSVGRGQIEAARSIGLNHAHLYRYVILPQALRVIVPPAASQYVSLFKNSSLGVAIGYPELFNISNTITTLSGHAIECVLIMAGIYLLISLTVALVMNLYNRSVQIRER
jgi:general L-amino acid transport system permease protein